MIKKVAVGAAFMTGLATMAGFWLWNHLMSPMGNLFLMDNSSRLLALGRLTGLLAMAGIAAQLLLIGRVRWVEQVFGLDRLSRAHHYIGWLVLLSLLLHPVLLNLSYAGRFEVSQTEQFLDFLKNWDGVLSAFVGFIFFLVGLVFSAPVLRRRLSYEAWFLTHLIFYLAIYLSIDHQFHVGGDFTGNPAFRYFWIGVLVFTAVNFAYFRFIRPMAAFARHRFFIQDVRRENEEVVSIFIGGRNLEGFRCHAGQFLIVRFLARGFWQEAHPFSVSAVPDGKCLRLSIKKCGDFTARAFALAKGTPVFVDGPHGVFTSACVRKDKVLLIAGGIGITPILSLGEELLKQGRDVALLYGNRTRATIAFEKELESLCRSHEKFQVIHVLSHDPSWPGERGMIDGDLISRLIRDCKDREIFLCGPPAMMQGVLAALTALGVPRSQIHFEKFSF